MKHSISIPKPDNKIITSVKGLKHLEDNRIISVRQNSLINSIGSFQNNIIQRRENITGADNRITIDLTEDNQETHKLEVHYKYGCINCKEYNNETQEITSSNFSGCIMAIFNCKLDIGEIKAGKKYAAHVGNDEEFSYKIGDTDKTKRMGKDLLQDLAEQEYIDGLKYFRPSFDSQNRERYNRMLTHKKRLALDGQLGLFNGSETGILKFNTREITLPGQETRRFTEITASHKFDTFARNEDNPEVRSELTDFNQDVDKRILKGTGEVAHNPYLELFMTETTVTGLSEAVYDNLIDKVNDPTQTEFSNETILFIIRNQPQFITTYNINLSEANLIEIAKQNPQYIANNNLDIGQDNYNNHLTSEERKAYRGLLKSTTGLKVPRWMQNKHWIIFRGRDTI